LSGPGLLPAALVLAIMILPTIAAVSQDALTAVPMKTKQAAYGMGTTHWEAILKVMVPSAATGIFGSLVLGLGRALGETMALAMLVGNANNISLSLFAPANTLAALVGAELPRSRPERDRGVDVRRTGADVHHAAGEHPRLDDHALRPGGIMTDLTPCRRAAQPAAQVRRPRPAQPGVDHAGLGRRCWPACR
jgi:hypothetical protein